MEELSRIEVAAQLLEEIDALCACQDLNGKYNIIYNFLLSDATAGDYDDTLCSNHGLELKLLNTYKKDAWLLILIDAYEYLISLSKEKDLTEEEQRLLTKLDALEFNFTNLYSFFTSPANRDNILIALNAYYEYWQKGNDFVKQHRDYNYENQTMFRNRLTAYIGNIEAMDLMATIFDDLDEKYQKEINMAIVGGEESIEFEDPDMEDYDLEVEDELPEDFDEEEYSAAVDEMFDDSEEEVEEIMERFKAELHSKILNFLEDYLDDKFDCDEFLGFFMSYVYMIILDNQKNGRLFREEEQLLKVLSLDDFSPALVIETFYNNPDYVFAALDTFCRYYYKHECDILSMRDFVDSSIVKQRINALDQYFPNDKKVENVQLIGNPFYEIYDMLYLQIKINNPTDYIEKLYLSLVEQKVDPAFYEFDLDDDINYHRVMMIRYFSRKFIESVSAEEMKATSTNEYAAFELLLSDNLEQKTFLSVFMRYGMSILKGYEKLLAKTNGETKNAIKNILTSGLGNKLFRIDPGMISDSLYYRALNDTPLFKYVEQYGVEQTIKYLINLAQSDYEQYEDYMKEVIASIYCHLKDVSKMDSTEYVVKALIDNEDDSLNHYFRALLEDESLMCCLLNKYYEIETMEDYPKPIEERIVEQPKVKQKLYPVFNEDNHDS